jgi:dTDP-glucose 4,6-dehydratase
MRYMVAGGAGFVGSHLCSRLLSEGHSVVCVDNFVTGIPLNIRPLVGNAQFELMNQDVSSPFSVEGPIDGVAHLASPASPLAYQRHAIATLKAGTYGTFNLLDIANAKGAWFFLTSTSEVYGDPDVHPQPEEYVGKVNPIGPRSMYDEAKRFAEAATMAYHRQYDTNVKIVRIFNAYGPGMRPDDGRVVPTFMSQAIKGEPLTLFGDGSQTRSLCYIDDLAEGIHRMMMADVQGPINIGNPEEVTMLELAEQVIGVTGSSSNIVFKPLPQDDPAMRRPDISKAQKLLGWQPTVSLETGLRLTRDWIQQALSLES